MESGQTILQMAGTTAAVGMGVVFCALLLLSVYMHYFKVFVARVEARHRAGAAAPGKRPLAAAPKLTPAPAPSVAADAAATGARIAAAIAVGLRLHTAGGAPRGEVVAAIAAALAMHRERLRGQRSAARAGNPWQMAGRLESMGARVRRQER